MTARHGSVLFSPYSNSAIKLTNKLFDLISDKIRFKNMDILMSQLSLEDICLFFAVILRYQSIAYRFILRFFMFLPALFCDLRNIYDNTFSTDIPSGFPSVCRVFHFTSIDIHSRLCYNKNTANFRLPVAVSSALIVTASE